ncbi:nuclear transport factor 2 family protein (plasmid) [Streptomyces sp. NBC_01450]|uniref:nuclear transport factor 2 family protein n=1 Tax=Streptomyces sp. NBC_01450 TaxID=2903871 RepID=UPI002E304D39|nr:nuclear transport factor 2 family protein [Streptomyces sp. NBC_01450]
MKNPISRRSAVTAVVGAIAAATLTVAGTASADPQPGRGEHRVESQVQHNRRVAVAFLDLAFNKKQPEEAAKLYVGDEFIQHNPLSADGTGPFIAYVKWRTTLSPELNFDIKRVFGEKNLVAVHYKRTYDSADRGAAVMDIFRFEKGKIVEHWDVIQDIPETSANDNTMF